MIRGDRISLRAWRLRDLATLTEIRNDVPLQAQLLARPRGSSKEQVVQWLQDRDARQDQLLFVIADNEEDNVLGFVQIVDIDQIDLRGDLGICLIREAQGRGLGREVLKLTISYARSSLGLRKINLKVRADNVRALACYVALGFKEVGLLHRHAWFDSAWRDVVLMELFLDPHN